MGRAQAKYAFDVFSKHIGGDISFGMRILLCDVGLF